MKTLEKITGSIAPALKGFLIWGVISLAATLFKLDEYYASHVTYLANSSAIIATTFLAIKQNHPQALSNLYNPL